MSKVRFIHEVRAVKNKKELANIIKAQRISEQVLYLVLKKIKTSVTEKEIEKFIKNSFVKLGAPILSFSPIVAFGKNTANIHHQPNKTKLREGDTIMLDFGCTVAGYCSDMTRTYFWGKASKRQKQIYLDVLKAQEKAIKKIKNGEKRTRVIDSSARTFLNKKYRNNFQHGLGHGVGTIIHEWPNFKLKSEDVLPVGCVMTVEPGIYLKGLGGVRIEDMVLITKNGYENLTNVPKDLESAVLK